MLLLLLFTLVSCDTIFNFPSSEVLVLQLNHSFRVPGSDVQYKPSLLDFPDLPSWLYYTYSSTKEHGYLYGAPPNGINNIKLEVITLNKQSYDLDRNLIDLNITEEPVKPNEVHFKITNHNIDDLITPINPFNKNSNETKLDLFKSILTKSVWPESKDDGVFASLHSATEKGDRLPLNPHDKEGVYICYASFQPFNERLKRLEMEAKPLWNHRPCPPNFKKTSFERFFSKKGFLIDWCNFRLATVSLDEEDSDFHENIPTLKKIMSERVRLIKQSEVPKRSYVWNSIETVLIPFLVMFVLVALLTLAMCCHRKSMDIQSSIFFDEIFDDLPRMPTTQDIQMVHYAGLNKAVDVMRTMKGTKGGREHSPHPSMTTTTTHVDTLPRSRTGSPSSTMARISTPRRFEDYATLSRPDPPPYHRNGSSHPCYE